MLSRSAEAGQRPVPLAHLSFSRRRWVYVRDLLWELIARDIRLRYKGSLLGQAWTLLNPLAELAVLTFVFDRVLSLNIPNYAAFLFTGLLTYGWFQTSLFYATVAIVSNRDLIRRPGVPSSILPLVTVGSTLVHFLLSLPILLALMMMSGVPMTAAALMLPAVITLQFLFILSLAYPLAVLHVWLRDTQYLLRVALQLLFYLTPVFYEVSSIPERFAGVYRLNPMVPLVEAYRDVLLRGRSPNGGPLIVIAAASAGLLVVGVVVFRKTSHRFADQL